MGMQATHKGALSTTVDAAHSAQDSAPATSVCELPSLRPGDMVGRFQVRRVVAEGGMGRIYLARDLELGRSVALKLVRPDRLLDADPDDFVREARITAQLNHPHIVQIHDIGRHGNLAYLALEYVEGVSLRDRLRRGPLSADESLRILRAIVEALCHAHAAVPSVIHCDLKPGNVMLAADGRVRVVDFGLAIVRSVAATDVPTGGTPDWMAPEQWREEPVSDRTDVWALAVIAHELLTGAHPFGPASRADVRRLQVLDGALQLRPLASSIVSDRIRAHLVGSLSLDPQVRPTARDWFLALDDALTGASSAVVAEAPFRGLAAFDERHAALFFGREADVDAFMERLRERPTVPIVGPSGVGKSSFLRAGVIPRLRARGGWTIILLRPGAQPFAAVANRLLAAVDDRPDTAAAAELADALRETPSLLAVRLATIAAVHGGQVLFAIDQLEELFTQGCAAREVERFVAMLAALDDAAEPARITYTLRDDFLGHVPGVRDVFVVRRLGVAELRRTITAPLDRLGYQFDNPAIVDDMLAETGAALIDLPLVQFACRALWDARDQEHRLLLASAYRAQGGVTGALARHADHLIDAMTAAEQRISRDLLGRLVVGDHARRIVERDALLDGLPAGADAVLDRLVGGRLLAQHRPAGADSFSVELAHESLLVNWGHLRRWLEDSGEERRLLHELDEATSIWERRGHRDGDVLPEAQVAAARFQAAGLALTLPARLDRFLTASASHHHHRRRRARLRRAIALVTALAVAAVALVIANRFRDQKLAAEAQTVALRLANDNIGRFELVMHPFDWRDGQPVPVDAALLPELRVSLYQPATGDADLPGHPVKPERVHITTAEPGTLTVEAPGGRTYLRIDGRGRAGETCAASWLRITSLPGYARRTSPKRIAITIPTCAASADDMITIPAGDFIYGGPGVPPTRQPSHVQPEQRIWLGNYWIDRLEVSNARFAPFIQMSSHTGYSAALYPDVGILARAGDADIPVTSVDAFEAEAYCRYMGKRLPTDHEWTKAARGGLVLAGQPNPEPRRLYPWVGDFRPCVNIAGDADGYAATAPVTAFACGASPYGVLNLGGNVAEWIDRDEELVATTPLRIVRGGYADSPAALQATTTIYRNQRAAGYSDFIIGVRCVAPGPSQVER